MTKALDPGRNLGVLISDCARLLRRSFDRRLQSLGLTQVQWRAIVHVARAEGMNQVALAEALEIQPMTVARLIDRMESAGWIERRNDPSDRRAVRLYLTPKSQPILDEIHSRATELMADVVDGVPVSTQKIIFDSLQRIKQNLSAAEPKTAATEQTNGRTHRDAGRKPTRLQPAR